MKSMASDINTGKAPCSNTAAAIDCLSPLVAIRLCDSLETAQPMLNTTLAIHLTSKKVDAFASVTHRLIQGYRFRVGPYRFCGASNPTTHSILLWSYLILSDAHIHKSQGFPSRMQSDLSDLKMSGLFLAQESKIAI